MLILFVTGFYTGNAQQTPLFNLYQHSMFMINPASAGNMANMQAFFDTHKQWSGVEGAPVTSVFGLHDSFSDKVGLGLLITSDKTHLIERLSGSLNYSYKLKISKRDDHFISFGLGLGFLENKINFDGVRVSDYSDPVIAFGNYDGFAFDATFGMNYHFKGLDLGVVIPQILDNKVIYSRNGYDEFDFDIKRHYIFYGGYRISFRGHQFDENMNKVKGDEENFFITPSVLYKTWEGVSDQLDINLVAGNKGGQWIGLTARPFNQSYIISAGLQVYNLGIGYAYQIANTDLTTYSNGTHEVLLTYQFGKSAAEETKVDRDLIDMMENQNNLKSQIDQLRQQLEQIRKEKEVQPSSQLEKLEEELKAEIDSLRNEIRAKNAADTSVVSGGNQVYSGGGDHSGEINELKAELEKLKQYVLRVQGEDVVELETVTDDNNQQSVIEKPIKDGCYVIIYSFRKLDYAQRAVTMTREKGYNSNILYNKDRKWYYIYTNYYKELEPALEKMRETRKGEYDDSWVHIYKQ